MIGSLTETIEIYAWVVLLILGIEAVLLVALCLAQSRMDTLRTERVNDRMQRRIAEGDRDKADRELRNLRARMRLIKTAVDGKDAAEDEPRSPPPQQPFRKV